MMKVTVLSGFLGSGKTTLLKHILHSSTKKKSPRTAVIVNDMGDINIDAAEIASTVVQQDVEMIELHNGCICCTLRGDLLRSVKELSLTGKFDYLVIESTGIGEPLPVAQTFVMDVDEQEDEHDDEEEKDEPTTNRQDKKRKLDKQQPANQEKRSLSHYATLDTLVTVVDALNIYDVLGSIETLADENNVTGMLGNTGASGTKAPKEDDDNEENDEVDDRPVSQLWLEQIEFANVIVISKAQLLLKKESAGGGDDDDNNNDNKLAEIKALLHKLNPVAQILVPQGDDPYFSDLDVAQLVNTGLFDMEAASASAGWLRELEKDQHTPETEEYGISSTTFLASHMPFHPERLSDILNGFGDYSTALVASANGKAAVTPDDDDDDDEDNVFQGVVRSKGQLWLANTNAFPIDFQSAGKHVDIRMNSDEEPFLAALNRKEWGEEEKETHQTLLKDGLWTEKFGDRRSELVFIGIGMDKKRIREELTSALMTEKESAALGGVAGWRSLADPFFNGAAEDYFELSIP